MLPKESGLKGFVERVQTAAASGQLKIVDRDPASEGAAVIGTHMPEHWLDPATFWLDEEVDPSTVSSKTVRLIDGSNGAEVEALVGLAGGHVVTVQPLKPLTNRGKYDFVLSDGIRDVAGRPVTGAATTVMVR